MSIGESTRRVEESSDKSSSPKFIARAARVGCTVTRLHIFRHTPSPRAARCASGAASARRVRPSPVIDAEERARCSVARREVRVIFICTAIRPAGVYKLRRGSPTVRARARRRRDARWKPRREARIEGEPGVLLGRRRCRYYPLRLNVSRPCTRVSRTAYGPLEAFVHTRALRLPSGLKSRRYIGKSGAKRNN